MYNNKLTNILNNKIAILDGAMGTQIQNYNLSETDFRGKLLATHPTNLKGNNDILVLTKSEIIAVLGNRYVI